MKNASVAAFLLVALCPTADAAYSTPVRIVEQPVTTQASKTPMNVDVQFVMSNAVINPNNQLLYAVPADKRFVIESISVWSFTTSCSFFLKPSITTTAGGETSEFRLPIPDRAFSPGGSGFYTHNSTWPIKLYADPNSNIFVNAIRTDGGCSVTLRISVSGYLEFDE
ncbi:MAG: hypothetical protein H6953_11880 [Chromatiaceae bacterium]|nr:hypothetical protein [Gammaproteobacteria bacterium]MCP5306131.1 hypothetical protein [Chromatiaceae bacterium]